MKLYTEEQVREAIGLTYLVELYGTRDIKYRHTLDEIIKKLTPIELPTDEEIESGMNQKLFLSDKHAHFNSGAKAGFKLGAKWMRDKILNK